MFNINKSMKRMLGPKVNIPKFKKPNKFDFDGDGISNSKDCQPRNPMRQDSKPNRLMRQRIEQLPIHYYDKYGDYVDIHEPTSNRRIIQARRNIYGTLKTDPSLITDIEKTGSSMTISGDKTVLRHIDKAQGNKIEGMAMPGSDKTGKIVRTDIFIRGNNKKEKLERVATLAHELKHAEQQKGMDYNDYISSFEKRNLSDKSYKEYYQDPREYEAERYAVEKISKRRLPKKESEELSELYMKRDYSKEGISDEDYQRQRSGILQRAEEKQGATIKSQMEWQNKNEFEKDVDRITKPDTDGDNVPDEYDEEY